MSASASASAAMSPLRLTEVLVGGLPPDVGVPGGPDRYTVPIVLSRRVTGAEKSRIEGRAVREELDAAGYRHIRLAVVDRRLMVTETTLRELAAGLGYHLTRVIDDAVQQIHDEDDARDRRARDAQTREANRLQSLTSQAALIDFQAAPRVNPAAQDEGERWDDDGGTPGRAEKASLDTS